MRTTKVGIAAWMGMGLLLAASAGNCHAQPGPEDGGSVLRSPFDDPAPRPMPRTATVPAADGAESATFNQILANLTVDPRYAMNRDIEPTPDIGPWMICVHSYVTKEAPEWSRQMAGELRSKYKLPAYVFTFGMEERRKEYARVKNLLDQQKNFLKDKDLPLLYAPGKSARGEEAASVMSNDLPLAYAMRLLKVQHIQVQCAVLVGGYPTEDAANRALLTGIRELKPPDPNRVKLDVKFYQKDDPTKDNNAEGVYVNPFRRAFVCRNPSIKNDRPNEPANDAMDINVLRRLNSDEPLTLLNCKKPITLAIKQFQTYTAVQAKEENKSILENFGFKTRGGSEGVDQAAHDAHNLAELLRKNKLEAYVLHTKFASIVTIGGYDSLEDPNLRAMHSTLESRLRSPEWSRIMFFARPMPMKVPH